MQAGAFDREEGDSRYTSMAIQPTVYILKNGLGFAEGNVVKYVSRWQRAEGLRDLRKAKHYIEMLIEIEEAKQASLPKSQGAQP